MRYLRYAFLAALGLVLLTVALANRGPVTLRLLPEGTGAFWGLDHAITLPLFLVIFMGIVVGLLVGFVWEWFREHKLRSAASASRREIDRLRSEVARTNGDSGKPKDAVLALLEQAPRR
ncbi:MAG: lipopolysaccharide assembly protein LapA domain-containing protein [Paracoccaceae bacterium]